MQLRLRLTEKKVLHKARNCDTVSSKSQANNQEFNIISRLISQGNMASTFDLATDEFLTCEIHSESTLPLLSYFIECKKHKQNGSRRLFQKVKSEIGDAERPIPDESEQLQDVLLALMKDGPGKPGEKIPGFPTVSALSNLYAIPR